MIVQSEYRQPKLSLDSPTLSKQVCPCCNMQSLQPFITPNSERRDTMFGLPETSVTSAHSPDSSIARGISFILLAVPNLVEIASHNHISLLKSKVKHFLPHKKQFPLPLNTSNCTYVYICQRKEYSLE